MSRPPKDASAALEGLQTRHTKLYRRIEGESLPEPGAARGGWPDDFRIAGGTGPLKIHAGAQQGSSPRSEMEDARALPQPARQTRHHPRTPNDNPVRCKVAEARAPIPGTVPNSNPTGIPGRAYRQGI